MTDVPLAGVRVDNGRVAPDRLLHAFGEFGDTGRRSSPNVVCVADVVGLGGQTVRSNHIADVDEIAGLFAVPVDSDRISVRACSRKTSMTPA